MNKTSIITALLALAAMAAQGQVNYRIDGNTGHPDFTGTLYFYDYSSIVDSVQVVKGVITEHSGKLPQGNIIRRQIMELNLPIINFQTKCEITASNIDEIEAAATAFKAQADAFRPETYEDASQSDTIAKTAGKAEKLIGEAIDRAVSGDIKSSIRRLEAVQETFRQIRL